MFLPKVVFITAFSILIISDSSAALIGRRFGRRKFLRKSLQGAGAFFVTALIVVVLAPKIAYIPANTLSAPSVPRSGRWWRPHPSAPTTIWPSLFPSAWSCGRCIPSSFPPSTSFQLDRLM